MTLATAYARAVPASFTAAVSALRPAPTIDPLRATYQHRSYVDRLQAGGYTVEILPADERFPDAPFVEDTAVIVGDLLVIARLGAPSRQGEEDEVEAALAGRFQIERVKGPATLEGGDVLHRGVILYVGVSERTNEAGIARLAELAAPRGRMVVPVPMQGALHLKSVVTPLDSETLIAAPGHFDPAIVGGQRFLWADSGGEVNVLSLPDGRVLVPDSKRGLAELIESAGFETVTVDVSEFEKADGGLTCLSLRTDDG